MESQKDVQHYVDQCKTSYEFIWLTRISKAGKVLHKEPACALPKDESHGYETDSNILLPCTCEPMPEQVACRISAISAVEHYDPNP